jgi:hypothetical protein
VRGNGDSSFILARERRRQQMVDEVFDAYLCWRIACIAVWDAHSRWVTASGSDATRNFGAYEAALDHEEHTAALYGGLIEIGGTVRAQRAEQR